MVYNMRVSAMITSISAAVLAPLLRLYSYGGLEPFLCVSSGQALFYMLVRLFCEVIDSVADLLIAYTRFGQAIYISAVASVGIGMYAILGSLPASFIMAICTSAWMRSSLQCASHFGSRTEQLLLRSGKPDSSRQPTSPSMRERLTTILLVAVLPMLPGIVSGLVFALPAPLVVPVAAILLGFFLHSPSQLQPIVRHIGDTLSGSSLFAARRKSPFVHFDRTTVLVLASIPLWGLVLFTQAGIVEEALRRSPPEAYFFSPVSYCSRKYYCYDK